MGYFKPHLTLFKKQVSRLLKLAYAFDHGRDFSWVLGLG